MIFFFITTIRITLNNSRKNINMSQIRKKKLTIINPKLDYY